RPLRRSIFSNTASGCSGNGDGSVSLGSPLRKFLLKLLTQTPLQLSFSRRRRIASSARSGSLPTCAKPLLVQVRGSFGIGPHQGSNFTRRRRTWTTLPAGSVSERVPSIWTFAPGPKSTQSPNRSDLSSKAFPHVLQLNRS